MATSQPGPSTYGIDYTLQRMPREHWYDAYLQSNFPPPPSSGGVKFSYPDSSDDEDEDPGHTKHQATLPPHQFASGSTGKQRGQRNQHAPIASGVSRELLPVSKEEKDDSNSNVDEYYEDGCNTGDDQNDPDTDIRNGNNTYDEYDGHNDYNENDCSYDGVENFDEGHGYDDDDENDCGFAENYDFHHNDGDVHGTDDDTCYHHDIGSTDSKIRHRLEHDFHPEQELQDHPHVSHWQNDDIDSGYQDHDHEHEDEHENEHEYYEGRCPESGVWDLEKY